jgi:glycogen debranching enzyme
MSAAAEQALAALALSRIARVVGREDLAAFFAAEHASLGQLINERFWDDKHQIYNDRTQDGRFITELEPGILCKHGFIFWPLIAEVTDGRGTAGLIAELSNRKSFNRSSGVASLSADSKGYTADGQYWRGSVWPPVQCIVQEGLRTHGQWPLARELANKYLQALLTAFEQEHTITENMEPDYPRGHGAREFVGWGGIGPISNLIEYVLGFQAKAPERLVEWRIERTDRHGIQNLSIGKDTIELICDRRAHVSAPCNIAVQSTGECTLKVISQGKTSTHLIAKGNNEIRTG